MNEQLARELWLPEESVSTARTAIWTAFKDDRAADGLFRLLAEAGDPVDTEFVREDMTRPENSVLERLTHDALKITELGICTIPDV